EPWEACASTVFKTVPFGRSGIPPEREARAPRSGLGLDAREARVGPEHLRDDERAVAILVVLEQEHERPSDPPGGAVQRVHERVARLAPYASGEAARRVVEVVRA